MENSEQMDFAQRLTLSPLEKYRLFGKFPYKMLLHFTLVILSTYQCLLVVDSDHNPNRIFEQSLAGVYFSDIDGRAEQPGYSVTQLSERLFSVLELTPSINEFIVLNANADKVMYELIVRLRDFKVGKQSRSLKGTAQELIDLLDQEYGVSPDNLANLKKLTNSAVRIDLKVTNLFTWSDNLMSLDESIQNDSSCRVWTVDFLFGLEEVASINYEINATGSRCNDKVESTTLTWVSLLALVFAVLCLGLTFRKFYEISLAYQFYFISMQAEKDNPFSPMSPITSPKTRLLKLPEMALPKLQRTWQDLGFREKARLFGGWLYFGCITYALLIMGSFGSLISSWLDQSLRISRVKELLIGFGTLLCWAGLIRFLNYSKQMHIFGSTFANSAWSILGFFGSVLPFFLGFAYCGQAMLWQFQKFKDTSTSIQALVAMMNGDIINDTFLQLWSSGLPTQIFLIVFLVLFYTAAQNVLCSVILEGYECTLREEERMNMLAKTQAKTYELQNRLFNVSGLVQPREKQRLARIRQIEGLLRDIHSTAILIQNTNLSSQEKVTLKQFYSDRLSELRQYIRLLDQKRLIKPQAA